MSVSISVTIITKNEENNLPRTLQSVDWADEVLVVDSGSQDATVSLAQQHGARVLQNTFEGYGQQKNFAQNAARHDWILNLDADEVVSEELREQIQKLLPLLPKSNGPKAYSFPRKTFYLNRWIRYGGWYPNLVTRFYNRQYCKWSEPQLHERLQVQGQTQTLSTPVHHYTFKNVEDQITTNLNYARRGAQDLIRKEVRPSLFKLWFKPFWKFLDSYFFKKGILDGIRGFIISINAAHSMFMKYAFLYETKFFPQNSDQNINQSIKKKNTDLPS